VDRRTFLAGTGAVLLAAPLAAEAQVAGKVHRIGLLFTVIPSTFPDQWPFYERMRELGWVYGRDFVAEYRVYGEQYDRVPELASELIRAGADLFVVQGGIEASRVQQVTSTIPIVTTRAGDLVAMGLAVSLARPGGNVTGIQTPRLATKHLSLLRDAIPRPARLGILVHGSYGTSNRAEAEAGAKALGVTLLIVPYQTANEFERAFSAFDAERVQGVLVERDAFMGAHAKTLAALAVKHRLPTISDFPLFAAQGGLMAYGYNVPNVERSAADTVDKILRGAKASEIPIQQATTFRLVINLTTAKALRLTIPPSLLGRADEVIQ
jgi:putative ABC transport system substrate-binding protein